MPKTEQLRFLQSVTKRCRHEANAWKKSESLEPPENFALLAPPGTGKTKCIKMVCQYFVDVLGWTPGVEFQTLTSQNRMAGRINGATLHSWGEVPIDDGNTAVQERRKSQKTGGSTMHNKAAGLRFLIIDEISTAALQLLGTLEKHTAQARQGVKFAMNDQGELLDWGGINLIIVGDWLQLPAVCVRRVSFAILS